MIKNPDKAIIGHRQYGPIFWGGNGDAVIHSYSYISRNGLESGCDIFIRDGSDSSSVCEANIGESYECPEGYIYGQQNTDDYLAGSKKQWLTTEVEVYQIDETFIKIHFLLVLKL